MTTNSHLMTISQASRIAGINRRNILKAIDSGRLQAQRVGHGYVISQQALADFMHSDRFRASGPIPKVKRDETI